MSQPRTHRERAEQVASVLLLRTDLYEHPETGDQKTAAELIARETFPAELVQAARKIMNSDNYWDQDNWNGLLDELEAALALYPDPEQETP